MATPATRIKGTNQIAAAENIATTRAVRSQDSRSVTRYNGHNATEPECNNKEVSQQQGCQQSAALAHRGVSHERKRNRHERSASHTHDRETTRRQPFVTNAMGEPIDAVKKRLAVAFADTGCIPAMMSSRPNSLTVKAPPKFDVHAIVCNELSSIPTSRRPCGRPRVGSARRLSEAQRAPSRGPACEPRPRRPSRLAHERRREKHGTGRLQLQHEARRAQNYRQDVRDHQSQFWVAGPDTVKCIWPGTTWVSSPTTFQLNT